MHEFSEVAGTDEACLPQFLWSASDQHLDPPIETRQALLPVERLDWPNAERLFLRLLARCERVPFANLFGVAGQAQDGIDVYARIHSPLSHEDSELRRPFVTLQSKRVQTLTASMIDAAVDLFLDGAWAERSVRFYYATSHSLKRTQLDEAVRRAEERLGERNIEFVPWGVDRVSALLTSEPELIDDFFGREWVRVTCGDDVARSLEHRLTAPNYATLRVELRQLYKAVFRTQDTGVANYGFDSTGVASGGFIILDGTEIPAQPTVVTAAERADRATPGELTSTPSDGLPTSRTTRHGSSRQLKSLVKALKPTHDDDITRQPLDEWVAEGRLNLLVGEPGSGKSSFLRFFASEILSDNPQSTHIARQYGRSLPIWLPFAFLSAHLKQAESNSVLSAVRAWLERQDCSAIWPLVEKALTDDRLLLIVDGLDEWTEPQHAERALGQLEIFLDLRQNISALTSTRPYALNVLGFTLQWRWERLAALTAVQQRAVVGKVLTRLPDPSTSQDDDSHPAASQIVIQVDSLLNELESLRHIADLARVPLFLVLLASLWKGEPLPPRRFDIYQRLIALLVIHHPKMRGRSSQLSASDLTSDDAQRVWAAVAFKLRQDNASGFTSRPTFRRLLVEVLTDDTVLYWSEPRARDAADDILTVAEQHFGLLVSYGSGTIGFIHRVLYEHLAGQHLATLTLDTQTRFFGERASDAAWRDVILSTLSAQLRPTDTKQLLEAATANAASGATKLCVSKELLADAIACGVALAPRDLRSYSDILVNDIETSPWHRHRVELLRSLTAGLASRSLRELLLPNFIRWMRARAAEPGQALYALARTGKISDDIAWKHLVWGLRHDDGLVKLQASEAIAKRFKGNADRLTLLLEIAHNTDSPSTAAAIVLGAAIGWPQSPETLDAISWARRQQSIPLRVAGIQAFRDTAADSKDADPTEEEKRWLLWLFRHERLGRTWERLVSCDSV
jgi:energy-coupling factor transporter ATP-binding protein EcfA2